MWSSNQRSCCWGQWGHHEGGRVARSRVVAGVEVGSSLQPVLRAIAPKRVRDVVSGQDGCGKQQQKRGQATGRCWRGEARQWQVGHARAQCRP